MAGQPSSEHGRRPMLLSRRWVQVSVLVFVAGFFGLGVAGYLNYTQEPPMPAAHRRRGGGHGLHPRRRHRRPGGLPAQRPHGVRQRLRPRRLPGPGLHRRLPAPLYRQHAAPVRVDRIGGSGGPHAADRGGRHQRPQDEPLRRGDRHAALHGRPGRRLRASSSATTRPTSREPSTQLRPAARGDHRPGELRQLTAFFAWTAWAAAAQRPGQQLLLHQQLAAGAGVGNTADRRRARLERAVASSRCWAASACCSSPSAATTGSAGGAASSDSSRSAAGRRRAHAGPARDRLVLPRDGRCCSCCRPWSARSRSTTAPTWRASSASTSRDCCPTTCRAPGTSSSRSSGSRPRSSRPASSCCR